MFRVRLRIVACEKLRLLFGWNCREEGIEGAVAGYGRVEYTADMWW